MNRKCLCILVMLPALAALAILLQPQPLCFGLLGDPQGYYGKALPTFKAMERDGIKLAFVLGDITDNGTADEYMGYSSMISGLDMQLYHMPGNHDLLNGSNENYVRFFGSPNYSIFIGDVHFIMLDNSRDTFGETRTPANNRTSSAQRLWLLAELEMPASARVVMFHIPLFHITGKADERYTISDINMTEAAEFEKIMESHGVGLVASGHTPLPAHISVNIEGPPDTEIKKTNMAWRNGTVFMISSGAADQYYARVCVAGPGQVSADYVFTAEWSSEIGKAVGLRNVLTMFMAALVASCAAGAFLAFRLYRGRKARQSH